MLGISSCRRRSPAVALLRALHAAAIPGGGRRRSKITVRGKQNLHAYWDGAISRERHYNGVRREVFDLLNDAELAATGKKTASYVNPKTWIQESYDLAKREVYTEHIRKLVAEAEGRENLGAMNPPREYDRTSARIADQRAVEAGFRLAFLLERLFPNDSAAGR